MLTAPSRRIHAFPGGQLESMPDVQAALQSIAARKDDPLAPVTFVVPSHVAGLQLRRRLAEMGPFAAVRFETLPRVAELLGAGHLATAGRSPPAPPPRASPAAPA